MKAQRPHPEVRQNLALIGGRGCGKSSIARRLSQDNRNFLLLSLDVLIRYEMKGRRIPEIVEQEGWAGFRDVEFQVLQRALAFERGALLDCGGGVVVDLDTAGHEQLSQRKVDLLQQHCVVIYLRRETAFLEAQIGGDANRPSLSGERSFREIMERRDPWYEAAAHSVLECGERSKSEIAAEVLEEFSRRGGLGEANRGRA